MMYDTCPINKILQNDYPLKIKVPAKIKSVTTGFKNKEQKYTIISVQEQNKTKIKFTATNDHCPGFPID